MLSIWIGRAGAGKSRRVLETMARQRSQRPQVLLVPEHISHEAEVDLCRALGPTASRDAEVLSFQSLGSRVLARTGGLAEFTLDGGGKLLTMRLALQELHSRAEGVRTALPAGGVSAAADGSDGGVLRLRDHAPGPVAAGGGYGGRHGR